MLPTPAQAQSSTPGICDRAQGVYEVIVATVALSNSSVTRCEDVTLTDLFFLNSLEFDGSISGATPITTLSRSDFRGLSNLVSLRIHGHAFAAQSGGAAILSRAFNGAPSLHTLRITGSDLHHSELSSTAFDGLRRLAILDLSGNQLDALPSRVVRGLTTLTNLNLDDNDYTSIPEGAITLLNQGLQTLTMRRNPDKSSPPFPFPYEIVQTDTVGTDTTRTATLEVRLPSYLPQALRNLTASLSVAGGNATLSAASVAPNTPFTVTAPISALPASVMLTATAAAVGDQPDTGLVVTSPASAFSVDLPLNFPATGTLTVTGTTTVTGTLSVGETLILSGTDTIADRNGLPNSLAFSYQWQRNSVADFSGTPTDISGASGKTYKLTADEAGMYVRASASFTDSAGNPESVASAPARIAATDLCTRTPQVQDELLARIAGVDNCAEATIAQLNGITGPLNLSNSTLRSLKSGDFADLSGVTRLEIDDDGNFGSRSSHLATLPAGVFNGLSAVTSLVIRNHDLLTTIESGAFTGMTALKTLLLNSNSINSLPEDVFTPLAQTLTRLDLRANDLTVFPAVALAVLPNLSTFRIDQNPSKSSPAFPVPYELVRTDSGTGSPATIEVRLPLYVPSALRNLSARLSVTGGTLALGSEPAADTVTVALNTAVTVTTTGNSVVIVSATPPAEQTPVKGMAIGATTDFRAIEGNTPATGTPTISGNPIAEQDLTAVTASIADDDGLPSTFGYQWQRSPTSDFSTNITDIPSATLATYTLTAGDVNHYLRVVVSFTDGNSFSEQLISAPTALISPLGNNRATGMPAISGDLIVPQKLTALPGSLADADGLPDPFAATSYQWQRSSAPDFSDGATKISGATNKTYTLTDDDEDQYLRVAITFTDDLGSLEAATSAITGQIDEHPNRPATGAPAITGDLIVPQTLTAGLGTLADGDGLPTPFAATYQWQRSSDKAFTNPIDISGATGKTYILIDADASMYIRVITSFTDKRNFSESSTSAATDQITPRPNRPATGVPSISGLPIVSQELTAVTTNIGDGYATGSFSYQWQRSASAGLTAKPTDISGATSKTYTLTGADADQYIRVVVTFTDGRLFNESVASVLTAQVAADQAIANSRATLVPVIIGDLIVPQTLTAVATKIADADALSNVSYQWQRSTSASFNPGEVSVLVDSPAATYALTDADEGQYIRVVISFSAGTSASESRTSAAIGPVRMRPNRAAGGLPVITGVTTVPQTLTAQTDSITDADNPANTDIDFNYQWQRSSDKGSRPIDIGGAIGKTYPLTDDDAGMYLRVSVRFTDKRGGQEVLTSAATVQITARPNRPATGTLTITGTTVEGGILQADATQVVDADGVGTLNYQWHRGDTSSFTHSPTTAIRGATRSTYTLMAADVDNYILVVVSFTDERGATESVASKTTAQISVHALGTITSVPSISGIPTVPQTLEADITEITDGYGLSNFSYQWHRNTVADFTPEPSTAIVGATRKTYTLTDDDANMYLRVDVSFTNGQGDRENLASASTSKVVARPNRLPRGALTISGTPTVPQLLTAVTDSIADADNPANTDIDFSYQWQRSTDKAFSNPIDIGGATDKTYTLTDADVGMYLRVSVRFTDKRGTTEALTSAATEQIAEQPNNPATGLPTIARTPTSTGAPASGQVLKVDTSSIADADGPVHIDFSYQWHSGAAPNFAPTPQTRIASATTTEYSLTDADVGNYILVVVSFTDDEGNPETLTSAITAQVAEQPNNPATGLPTIARTPASTGAPASGQVLKVDTSSIADADGPVHIDFSYQWHSGDATNFKPSLQTRISGATTTEYSLTDGDVGNYIRVVVSFTDGKGNPETLTSATTAAVGAVLFTSQTMSTLSALTDLSTATVFTEAVATHLGAPASGLRIDGQIASNKLRSILQAVVPAASQCQNAEPDPHKRLRYGISGSSLATSPCDSLDADELMRRLRSAAQIGDVSLGVAGKQSGLDLWLHATSFNVSGSPLVNGSELNYDGNGLLAYLGLALNAGAKTTYGFTLGLSDTLLDLALSPNGARNDSVARNLMFGSGFIDYRLGAGANYRLRAVLGLGSGSADFTVVNDSSHQAVSGNTPAELTFFTLNFSREFKLSKRLLFTPSIQLANSSGSTDAVTLTGDGTDVQMGSSSSKATELALELNAKVRLSNGGQFTIGGAFRNGSGDLEYNGAVDIIARYQGRRFSAQLQQQVVQTDNERSSYSFEYVVLRPKNEARNRFGLTLGTDYNRTTDYTTYATRGAPDALSEKRAAPLRLGYFGRFSYSFGKSIGKENAAGSGSLDARLRLNQDGDVSTDLNLKIRF